GQVAGGGKGAVPVAAVAPVVGGPAAVPGQAGGTRGLQKPRGRGQCRRRQDKTLPTDALLARALDHDAFPSQDSPDRMGMGPQRQNASAKPSREDWRVKLTPLNRKTQLKMPYERMFVQFEASCCKGGRVLGGVTHARVS